MSAIANTYPSAIRKLCEAIEYDDVSLEMARVAFAAVRGPGLVPPKTMCPLDLAIYLSDRGIKWADILRINT